MIVVAQSNGRIGNRLEQFSHIIAFARTHGVKIANPAFSLYSEFFEQTHCDILCRYPARPAGWVTKNLQRFCYYIIRLGAALRLLSFFPRSVWIEQHWTADEYDLGNAHFVDLARMKNLVFLTGTWMHRYWSGYEASLGEIRNFFALAEPWSSEVRRVAESFRSRGEVAVGVHIRQTDFKDHLGGGQYFTTLQYAKVMRAIGRLFSKKVVFLICSDRPQDLKDFDGLECVQGRGHFIADMYALAECDYIVGPAISSFSGWASLMGQKPRYALVDAEKEIRLVDFEVCKGIK